MQDTALQALARIQIRDIARRLIAALGTIYTTPQQGRLLEGYLRHHIFTQRDLASLPAAYPGHQALADVAAGLTDDFFANGRDRELGWRIEGAPPKTREVVRAELAGLIQRLLLLPGERIEWRGEWTEELRQAAVGAQAKVEKQTAAEEVKARRDQLVERVALRAADVSEALRSQGLASDRCVNQNGADAGEMESSFEATAGTQREDQANDSDDEDDDFYKAQQESLLTQLEEDRKRAREQEHEQVVDDAAWAESVESRLASDKELKSAFECAFLEHGHGDDGKGVDELHGVIDEGEGQGANSLGAAEGRAAVEDFIRGHGVVSSEEGSNGTEHHGSKEGESGRYGCDMCEQRFGDALTLNEHYAKHFGE